MSNSDESSRRTQQFHILYRALPLALGVVVTWLSRGVGWWLVAIPFCWLAAVLLHEAAHDAVARLVLSNTSDVKLHLSRPKSLRWTRLGYLFPIYAHTEFEADWTPFRMQVVALAPIFLWVGFLPHFPALIETLFFAAGLPSPGDLAQLHEPSTAIVSEGAS